MTLFSQPSPPAPARRVTLRRGSLHLDADTVRAFFAGLDTVVLVGRDARMMVLPVRDAAAGGLLLKVRNARGDRVVHVDEFLRAHGYADDLDAVCPAVWEPELCGLAVTLPTLPAEDGGTEAGVLR
jgi:hypothetical protein